MMIMIMIMMMMMIMIMIMIMMMIMNDVVAVRYWFIVKEIKCKFSHRKLTGGSAVQDVANGLHLK
ncbi:hypothetical protein MAR_003068 [Mya arenaria]|uniref:Secreted protein n=1 Tax=Mya arenaria TaxID=6604 RepID=A0ABY7G4Y6_MYAAR|nr:hypothetical protein MAR_003068 [Mya arenaria]